MRTLIFIAFVLFISACDSIANREKSPEELKMELLNIEKSTPVEYLSIEEGSYSVNEKLFGGYKVKGSIHNAATLAKYKDVVVNIKLYSETQTEVSSVDYTIYKFFEPSSSKEFLFEIDPGVTWEKYKISISSAISVN